MTWHNGPDGDIDPDYHLRWAGSSMGGPQGDLQGGLDAGDSGLTGNSVCMDTYLQATVEYQQYCEGQGLAPSVFFTTGPVDGYTDESGYQRYIKHQYIREYFQNTEDTFLFDYADILCWSNDGVQNTTTWTDHNATFQVFQHIHSDNMMDLDGSYTEDGDHIGERGAVRLAKALWWMLARIAGWGGA